jgi:hypothetical protein
VVGDRRHRAAFRVEIASGSPCRPVMRPRCAPIATTRL